jgi:hypothetical protein
VGLIRDYDVDFLCFEKDEILVNDDDHEDLIRVTKLMGYMNNKSRLEYEDLSRCFNQLVRPFNKSQVIKSIPYYFKQSESNILKDYRVYYYD